MSDEKSLKKALFEKTKELLVLTEPVLKEALELNEMLKSIPVLSSIAAFINITTSMSDRIFAKKLLAFINDPSISFIKKEEFKDKYLIENKTDEELQMALILAIDSASDLKKPALIAKMFRAYLDDIITRDTLILLMHTVTNSSILDLQLFVDTKKEDRSHADGMAQDWKRRLSSTGLYNISSDIKEAYAETESVLEYHTSDLGAELSKVIEYATGFGKSK